MTFTGRLIKMLLMTGKSAAGIGNKRTTRILRIIARVISIIVIVFFLLMVVGEGAQSIHEEGFQGITVESLYVLIPVIIVLAAFIVSWWRELTGGIMLIAAYLLLSVAPSIHSIYYGEGPHFYIGMFFFASPLLISGILFIVAARLSKRTSD